MSLEAGSWGLMGGSYFASTPENVTYVYSSGQPGCASGYPCSQYGTIRETWTTELGTLCERWWCSQHAPKPKARKARKQDPTT